MYRVNDICHHKDIQALQHDLLFQFIHHLFVPQDDHEVAKLIYIHRDDNLYLQNFTKNIYLFN